MTIWNALAAGGALWCLAFTLAAPIRCDQFRPAWRIFPVAAITALAFGLCLWGAIP